MRVIDNLNLFCCPDCKQNGYWSGLRFDKNASKIYCPRCRRKFYFENDFIDLLPKKPKRLEENTPKIFRNYYFRQFSIPPNRVYKRTSAWGVFDSLGRGYRIFLESERELFQKFYPMDSDKKVFCDISASSGTFSFAASKLFKLVVHGDINLKYIQYARKAALEHKIRNIIFVRMDYLQSPFAKSVLDVFLSTDTFIYYGRNADVFAIKRLLESLKSDGVFIFDIHARRFYIRAKRIFEYGKKDIMFLRERFPQLEIYPVGFVPTFIHPFKFLFRIFSKLSFLPPIRYVCVIREEKCLIQDKQIKGISYYLDVYDDQKRWISYWYQIKEVLGLKPESVLVIGVGNGVVPYYLSKLVKVVKTLDIDKSLKPDFLSDVRYFDTSRMFDVVLCAEVLNTSLLMKLVK